MLRRNRAGKGGRGGSYKLRVRISQGKGMVGRVIEPGLGTNDLLQAQEKAIAILLTLQQAGYLQRPPEYVFTLGGYEVSYERLLAWKDELRREVRRASRGSRSSSGEF
ncbi:hypothetical protein AC781_04965 [Akkermansia glycaniphila]|nr:hypothetical protein AC781_04965 [Akkermansia glycaniphila]